MTSLPTSVLPVKTRWSNGSDVNASATSGPPVTTATSVGSNISATASASTCAVCGTISDGLRIARLPAPSAHASGLSSVNSGAFHVPMMPTEPLGWYWMYAFAPSWSYGGYGGRSSSSIHDSRESLVCLSDVMAPRMSFMIEKATRRPPKSASIASVSGLW